MDLSVIIVNYNVRQFLENSLLSIQRALQGMAGEIFVVDNASDDGSAEMVRSKFPGVRCIENRENIGFSRANNIALAQARGDLILLINPDTIVQEETFRVMKAFFDATPDAGLAGCTILNPDGSFQLPCRRSFPTPWVAFTKIFGLSALFPRSRIFGQYNLTYLDPEKTYRVDAVSGSFMMVRRSVVEKVGGLDESFFMYGEDLDWCFRIGEAGYGVYYVHGTSIIHFKGESTRRSNIDELRHFYGAMGLFVEKHFKRSGGTRLLLKAGILLRSAAAFAARSLGPVAAALTDAFFLNFALFLSAYWHFQSATKFTFNAHPLVWVVPAMILVAVASGMGVYTTYRRSIARSSVAVVVAYLFISALVFFAKDFAYSRLVVVLSGVLAFVFLPGWRMTAALLGWTRRRKLSNGRIFGSRTLVVGAGAHAEDVIRKLRANVMSGYAVVGLIDATRKRIGEKVGGVEIVGSTESIARAVEELRITEVIFAMGDGLSYADMLAVVARSGSSGVNYRLVPTGQEAVLGKTRIDDLATLPLMDLEYNLHRPWNRFTKRLFDLLVALPLTALFYLPVRIATARSTPAPGSFASVVMQLPLICFGTMSFVGYPAGEGGRTSLPPDSLGKPGLTGILQINTHSDLRPEEREQYLLSYAKNHSLGLDLEILLKALLQRRRHP